MIKHMSALQLRTIIRNTDDPIEWGQASRALRKLERKAAKAVK